MDEDDAEYPVTLQPVKTKLMAKKARGKSAPPIGFKLGKKKNFAVKLETRSIGHTRD